MTKIVLVGAGSAQFGLGTLGEIMSCPALLGAEVVLLDINAEALQRVHSAAQTPPRRLSTEKSAPSKFSGYPRGSRLRELDADMRLHK